MRLVTHISFICGFRQACIIAFFVSSLFPQPRCCVICTYNITSLKFITHNLLSKMFYFFQISVFNPGTRDFYTNSNMCISLFTDLMRAVGSQSCWFPMADGLPSGLLEACIVVGSANEKLKELSQVKSFLWVCVKLLWGVRHHLNNSWSLYLKTSCASYMMGQAQSYKIWDGIPDLAAFCFSFSS